MGKIYKPIIKTKEAQAKKCVRNRYGLSGIVILSFDYLANTNRYPSDT